MKKRTLTIVMLLSILATLASNASASQEKDIYLDTRGQIGHLIYEEYYYSVNNNTLIIDKALTYFNGTINNSRITFMITRPLDKQGNQYSDDRIRAIATIDNVTILNTWYSIQNKTENLNEVKNNKDLGNAPLIGLASIIGVLMLIILLTRILIKNLKSKNRIKE